MRFTLLAGSVRLAAAGLLGVVIATSPAVGQGGPGEGGRGGGGGMRGFGGDFLSNPVSSRDLDAMAKVLGLTPEQLDAAKALLDTANAEFQPAAKAARDKMEAVREEFRETRDPSVWQGMAGQMGEMRQVRQKIEASFMTDVQGLLTPEQTQLWPSAERLYRRNRTMGRGLISGERVDLFRLMERAEVPESVQAELKPVMEQYEVELDRELVKRNEIFDKAESQMGRLGPAMFQMMQGGGGDNKELTEMFEKGRDAALRVREVNRKYARQIEAMLPEEARAEFIAEFKRESFPMIYRPSYASRVVEAAEKMTDLDAAQKQGVTAIKDSFTRETNALNARAESAIEESEKNVTPQTMFSRFNDPTLQEIRDARRKLEDQMVQKINDLLTEAQKAQLPERGRGDAGGGRGQFDDNTNARPGQPRRARGGQQGADGPANQPRRGQD
ncbi:MAG: Spy/CpxP family protein refolding chaperone [Phycisphaeraceae bacterium]|nr:Spy/CpxP family protein refolding chaperone [Phycisphaeraceae bacterium]